MEREASSSKSIIAQLRAQGLVGVGVIVAAADIAIVASLGVLVSIFDHTVAIDVVVLVVAVVVVSVRIGCSSSSSSITTSTSTSTNSFVTQY